MFPEINFDCKLFKMNITRTVIAISGFFATVGYGVWTFQQDQHHTELSIAMLKHEIEKLGKA